MTCSLHNNSTLYRKPSIEFSLNSSCNLNSPHPILERRKLTSRHVTLSIKLIFDSLLLCLVRMSSCNAFGRQYYKANVRTKTHSKRRKQVQINVLPKDNTQKHKYTNGSCIKQQWVFTKESQNSNL